MAGLPLTLVATLSPLSLRLEPQCEHKQTDVRRDAERRQDGHDIAAGAELLSVQPILAHLREELLVSWQRQPQLPLRRASLTLLSPEQTDEENPSPVHRKQRADGVELGREDLQHNERKRELSNGGADVRSFKRSLCCPDLDQFTAGQHDRACAVLAQTISVGYITALQSVSMVDKTSQRSLTSNTLNMVLCTN